MMFKEMKSDKPGFFTTDDNNDPEARREQSPSTKFLEIMLDYYVENNYLHSEVKK